MGDVAFSQASRSRRRSEACCPARNGAPSPKPTPSTSGSPAGSGCGARSCFAAMAATRAGSTRSGRRSGFRAAATRRGPCLPSAIRGLVDRIDYGLHRRIPRGVPRELQPGPVRRCWPPSLSNARPEQTQNFSLDAPSELRHVLSTFPVAARCVVGEPVPRSLMPRQNAHAHLSHHLRSTSPARHTCRAPSCSWASAWARPLETTWYVQSNERPAALEAA